MNRVKNQRVQLLAFDSEKVLHTGELCGAGFMDTTPVYLIRLDNGFYDPTGTTFIKVIVVDRNSEQLRVEESD